MKSYAKKGKTPGRDKAVKTNPTKQENVGNFMRRIATGKDDEMKAVEREVSRWYGKKPRPEVPDRDGVPNLQGSHPLRTR